MEQALKPFDPYTFLDATSIAVGLPVPVERRDAVAANLARLHALAQEVLAFDPPLESMDGETPTV